MSAAAEASVKNVTHPKVKGSRCALLTTIATLIPEGETMTKPIRVEDLATLTGYYEKSIRDAREVLVSIGVLRIVGGGPGVSARYELLDLPGAGPDPLLPLIGRLRRRAHATTAPPAGPDLFAPSDVALLEEPAVPPDDDKCTSVLKSGGRKYRQSPWWLVTTGTFYRWLWATIGTFYRWLRATTGTFYRKCRETIETVLKSGGRKYRKSHSAVDVDTRARAKILVVDQKEEVVVVARAREADEVQTFFAWWTATFPLHNGGARNVLDPVRHGRKVRDLLQTRPLARLQAMALALWSIESDGRADDNDRHWITKVVTVRTIDVLKHKADFLDAEVARRERAPPSPGPERPPWCSDHTPPCRRWTEHRERTLADARAARSG